MVDVLNVIGWILLLLGGGVVWGFVGVFVSALVGSQYDYYFSEKPQTAGGVALALSTFVCYTIVSGYILVFGVPL